MTAVVDQPGQGANIEARVTRLELDMQEMKGALAQILQIVTRIEATLPYLATKAELADMRAELRADLAAKPSHAYLWAVLATVIAAFTAGVGSFALLR